MKRYIMGIILLLFGAYQSDLITSVPQKRLVDTLFSTESNGWALVSKQYLKIPNVFTPENKVPFMQSHSWVFGDTRYVIYSDDIDEERFDTIKEILLAQKSSPQEVFEIIVNKSEERRWSNLHSLAVITIENNSCEYCMIGDPELYVVSGDMVQKKVAALTFDDADEQKGLITQLKLRHDKNEKEKLTELKRKIFTYNKYQIEPMLEFFKWMRGIQEQTLDSVYESLKKDNNFKLKVPDAYEDVHHITYRDLPREFNEKETVKPYQHKLSRVLNELDTDKKPQAGNFDITSNDIIMILPYEYRGYQHAYESEAYNAITVQDIEAFIKLIPGNISDQPSIAIARALVAALPSNYAAVYNHRSSAKKDVLEWGSSLQAGVTRGETKTIEDYIIHEPNFGDNESLFAVFDGHGGDSAAKHATEKLPEYLRDELKKNQSIQQSFENVFQKLEDEILAEDVSFGGATATVAYIKGNDCHFAWVGDSRAIVFNAKDTSEKPYATIEHDFNNENEKARLIQFLKDNTTFEISFTDGRETRIYNAATIGQYTWDLPYIFSINMTKSLGDKHSKPNTKLNAIIATPEYHRIILALDDIIIVASDGIWDVMPNEQVIDMYNDYLNVMLKSKIGDKSSIIAHRLFNEEYKSLQDSGKTDGNNDRLQAIANLLKERAKSLWRGRIDDISVIVIKPLIKELGEEAVAKAEEPTAPRPTSVVPTRFSEQEKVVPAIRSDVTPVLPEERIMAEPLPPVQYEEFPIAVPIEFHSGELDKNVTINLKELIEIPGIENIEVVVVPSHKQTANECSLYALDNGITLLKQLNNNQAPDLSSVPPKACPGMQHKDFILNELNGKYKNDRSNVTILTYQNNQDNIDDIKQTQSLNEYKIKYLNLDTIIRNIDTKKNIIHLFILGNMLGEHGEKEEDLAIRGLGLPHHHWIAVVTKFDFATNTLTLYIADSLPLQNPASISYEPRFDEQGNLIEEEIPLSLNRERTTEEALDLLNVQGLLKLLTRLRERTFTSSSEYSTQKAWELARKIKDLKKQLTSLGEKK